MTVERPLRLRVELGDDAIAAFRKVCEDAGEAPLASLIDRAASRLGAGPYDDYNMLLGALRELAEASGVKLTAKRRKLLQTALARRDENAVPLVAKVHASAAVAEPIRGLYEVVVDRKRRVVEYEPDTELRDTEQVPLLEDGGIEAFLRREVLPYAPDAWYDPESVKIGYEISFTRYFYQPKPLRSLEEIRTDILALEKETEGLLAEIIGESP